MAGLVPAIHVFSFRARGLPPDDRLRYADAEPRAARSLRAASRRHEGCIMKGLLAGATLVVAILLVGAAAFARKGFPVYVVDHAGRARSGFDPTPVNRAKAEGSAAGLPEFLIATRELAWVFFRIGPSPGTPHPGTQFPLDALDQYVSQLVPNTESTLPGAGANTVRALAALLDKIGPAVVLVHSQSGAYGMDLVRNHAAKVRAFVNVEGNCVPATPDEIANTFKKVPMLSVWGDFSEGAPGPNGDTRRNGCVGTVNALRTAGGNARYLLLPEVGQKGNSHMLMLDKNNLAIADLIIGWIGENVRGM
jgi:hypothetical protein